MSKPAIPDWTHGYRVDEAIECLPYQSEGNDVEHALLAACPDAYEDDNHHPDGEPIIEDRTEYRTSKTFANRSLARVWRDLPEKIREKLQAAYVKDRADFGPLHFPTDDDGS